MDLLNPEPFLVNDADGKDRHYILSSFTAIAGREIVTKYPMSAMGSVIPKLESYATSEEVMYKLMHFVGVQVGDRVMRLSTRELIDNHIPDWETLAKVEMAMMKKNCSFFQNGTVSGFLADAVPKLLVKITEILTPLLEQLSQQVKQPSTSLEASTV